MILTFVTVLQYLEYIKNKKIKSSYLLKFYIVACILFS